MIKIEQVYEDFRRASAASKKLFDEIESDFEFTLGKQWDDADAEELRRAGVEPLTINKLKPLVKIITGIERQGRSDFLAFPEGQEDSLAADVITRLMKNVMKSSRGDEKLSEVFKHGIIGGVAYLEPYIDYTYDLLNGEMKFRKISGRRLFLDPSGEEYDLSDRRYVVKLTTGLTKDQLIELFPDREKEIDTIGAWKADLGSLNSTLPHIQYSDYPAEKKTDIDTAEEKTFDLIEYYYKKQVNKFYVVDAALGTLKEAGTKDEALAYQSQYPDSQVIRRRVPEYRLAQVVGNEILSDEVVWSFPRWKGFPFIPFFAEVVTEDIKNKDLLIQGVVRSLKSLQFEYNKRRTQSLRHLNSSVNSGFLIPKGALGRREKANLMKYGSSPGFVEEYDPQAAGGTIPESWRLRPQPLSAGHEALAAEVAQDLKESGGINPDLLANDSNSDSGRAILLRQRQGLIMVQEVLDNYSYTKKILGRFLLSQLGEIFTVETAAKVIGEQFLKNDPAFQSPQTGPDGAPQIDRNGKLVTQIDKSAVAEVLNKVLNDSALGKYDVSIGEGPYNETVKMMNYMMMMDLASKGIPIPPEIIIQESSLPEGAKNKILTFVEAQRMQAAKVPGPMPEAPPEI